MFRIFQPKYFRDDLRLSSGLDSATVFVLHPAGLSHLIPCLKLKHQSAGCDNYPIAWLQEQQLLREGRMEWKSSRDKQPSLTQDI